MPNTEPENTLPMLVHVAVGVIVNSRGEVLLGLRHNKQHQGGLWEFPGGKVEADETVQQALARELLEEVHLQVSAANPLLKIHHNYGDKQVLLDVWTVEEFKGEAQGREGQPLRWVAITDLNQYQFPEANAPIVLAIQNTPYVDPGTP